MFRFAAVTLPLAQLANADLRMASQPANRWRVDNPHHGSIRFVPTTALYMEPSDFNYQGLKNQRSNNYDNFLRSNIDNEQDNRNFNTEEGRDHLPFRSWEGQSTDNHTSVLNKIPSGPPGSNITATPGQPFLVPLRWNNPHSSELEVNVWIMENKYVVPIRKPTCAGEGYRDAVFAFTIPSDFNELGSKVPGFAGCTQVGDCVLQIYAHSVETRTYAIGTPLVVTGFDPAVHGATAQDESKIAPAGSDPGLSLSKLRDLCLPSNDPSANIQSAQPQMARYVSDVYNHAYQNSDFSPYSGQQPQAISKNLQAACILKMVSGNRGELGKEALKLDNPRAARAQAELDRRVQHAIRHYEHLANSLINVMGERMQTNDTMGLNRTQRTELCFRCANVGSIITHRETTTTYIPSFAIPSELLPAVLALVGDSYRKIISEAGLVQIYVSALKELGPDFVKAAQVGIHYQPAVIKPTIATMADATNFTKVDASGTQDKGVYAAREAAKLRPNVTEVFRAKPVQGVRFVRIDQPRDWLQVSYVEVLTPTGANAALNKTVTVSSNWRDRTTGGNGTVQGAPGVRSFPFIYHSGAASDSWWLLDLGSDTTVSMVTYYNRGDCCQWRATLATMQLLDANRQLLGSSQLSHELVQPLVFGPPEFSLVEVPSLLQLGEEADADHLLEVDGEGRLRAEHHAHAHAHAQRAVRPWARALVGQRLSGEEDA